MKNLFSITLVLMLGLALQACDTIEPAPQPTITLPDGYTFVNKDEGCMAGQCEVEIAPSIFVCRPCPDPPPGG